MDYSKEYATVDMRTDEERTVEVILGIANSLNKDIKLTWEISGKNINNRIPVLDLEIWIKEIDGVKVVLHSFYKKGVASPFIILKRRALSYSVKKSTLLQEAMRRLGNILDKLP